MRHLRMFALFLAVLSLNAYGQKLSDADRNAIHSARARYYDLKAAGFESLNCSIKFDFSTVPLLSSNSDDPTRKLVEAIKFTLTVNSKGFATLTHQYPPGSSVDAQQHADKAINLLNSLVLGVFRTWQSKAFQGPIPPFDSQIESVASTEHGYVFDLRVPGAPVQIFLNRNYVVTKIISEDGKITEQPEFAPSTDGLIFVGNEAVVDRGVQQGSLHVKYEIENSVLNGLDVPSSVHLRVDQNIDTKFALDGCTAKKALVLNVAPPTPKGQ